MYNDDIINSHSMFNKTRVGLFFGVIYTLCHLIWGVMLMAGWAQKFMDWMFEIHGLTFTYSVATPSFGTIVLGVVIAFVWGFIDGFILCALWNWIVGSKE